MAKPRKRRKIIVFSIIGVVLVGLTLTAFLRKKDPVITVQTEKVTRRTVVETVMANGRVQPVVQVVISPEVAGEIVSLPVKEGDCVKKGDLLVQIKPDTYVASRNSAEANHKSAIASRDLAKAQLDNAEAEYKRNLELFENNLVSDSMFLDIKTRYEVAKLQYENAVHYVDQARFGLDKAIEDLSKTTIVAPMDGTVVRLQSQLGERVLGTSFNKGTEIMTIADLNEMEARVDISEIDVVKIKPGQYARLEIDAFRDRKFTGTVTEIANSAKGLGMSALGDSGGQDATRFEVRIRINEKEEVLRPGMSVTAEIETRQQNDVLTVPIASVTTRPPKVEKSPSTDSKSGSTNAVAQTTSASTNVAESGNTNRNRSAESSRDRKSKDAPRQVEVVFVVEGDHVRMAPVKLGINDDDYYEVTAGLKEGEEVVSGSYRAIRDLEDGKKVVRGSAGADSGVKTL